jgi:flagellar biosynthesis protein FlhG
MDIDIAQPGYASDVLKSFGSYKEVGETESKAESAENKPPRIIAIGGGKGGVGKTVVATMLGMCIAKANKKAIIVDADFSGANLHACLDTFDPQITLQSYLTQPASNINDVTLETSFKNLRIITGMPGSYSSAQVKYWEKQKLLRNLKKLKADYVLLDLGPGNFYTNIDFFLSADDKVIVTTPDALSMYDAYGFLRVALFRKLQKLFRGSPEIMAKLQECGDPVMGNRAKSLKTILEKSDDLPSSWHQLIEGQIAAFRPKIILNLRREADSRQEFQALRLVAKNLLGVDLDFWGEIRHDQAIRTAVKSLRPEMLLTAGGKALEDIERIVKKFVNPGAPSLKPQNGTHATSFSYGLKGFRPHAHSYTICNYRCIAWNCCDQRNGGSHCARFSPPAPRLRFAEVEKRDNSRA